MPQFRPLSETKFINDANLVAYYKLEDINDSKGSYTLTNNNSVAFNAAKFGNGADFGASNSNKSLQVASNLGISENVTISTWIKMNTEISSSLQIPIALCNATNKVTYQVFYNYNGGTRQIQFYRVRNAVDSISVVSTITLGTSDYYNLVLTYNGSNLVGYINGKLIGSSAGSGAGSISLGDHLTIGCGVENSFFASCISDDTAIFSRALSASEVNELYQGMTLGEYLPNSSTKLLLHLNGSSVDSSGNNNHGTDTNITYSQANGKFGQGAGFNGSSSYISIPDSASLQGTGSHTFNYWVKTPSTLSNNTYIFGTKCSDYPNGPGYGMLFLIYKEVSVYQFDFVVVTTSPSSVQYDNKGFVVSADTWYLATGVFDNSSGKSRLYVNGNLIQEISTGTTLRHTNGNASIVGALRGTSGNYAEHYSGSTDEVRIENRAWSASEVKKYYTMTKGRFGII